MRFTTRVVDLSSSSGICWEFKPRGGKWTRILTPHGGWKTQGHTCDTGTYRAEIAIPRSAKDRLVHLYFHAVNFGAEVYAGESEKRLVRVAEHVNGWLPFAADLTSVTTPGRKLLVVVKVRGRNAFLRNGKYLVPEGAPWQEKLADGIIRGVELRLLPKIHISDIFIRTDVAEDVIHAQFTLSNEGDQPVRAHVTPRLLSRGGRRSAYPELRGLEVQLEAGEERMCDCGRSSWGLGPRSWWWPNVPYREGYRARLHQMEISVSVGGRVVHLARKRFGFRQFEARGPHYYLNGIRCNLRGDNQQEANFGTDAYGVFPGFGPPSEKNPGWPQAVDNLQRANMNILRVHQIPGTDYMLDVCDEMGLMIISESPVRGSEGKEDFVGGRANMIASNRELVLRDRNHPSVVIWSAGNETWGERGLMLACHAAIVAEDDTRPVIVDGVEDMGAPLINTEHYVGGLGVLPEFGGTPRTDRPYGETESVWPMDNTRQGFAWISTATRIRRLKNNADIRNYVLNNPWPNYVPGQTPRLQFLEKAIKKMAWAGDMRKLASIHDVWANRLIRLMQKSFSPVAAFDIWFDDANKQSNDKGGWPVVLPKLYTSSTATRELAVFNDEFEGETLLVKWEIRAGKATPNPCASGSATVHVPLGEYRRLLVRFAVPDRTGRLRMAVRVLKNGKERFVEDRICFRVVR